MNKKLKKGIAFLLCIMITLTLQPGMAIGNDDQAKDSIKTGEVVTEQSAGTPLSDEDKSAVKKDVDASETDKAKDADSNIEIGEKTEKEKEEKSKKESNSEESTENKNIGRTNDGSDQYPAFSKSETVADIKITVESGEDVFPENAGLSVSLADPIEKANAENAVSKKRDDDVCVAISRTFDIKIINENGEEVQPPEGKNVKVTFKTDKVSDPNLDTDIYHISRKSEDATKMDVRTDDDSAEINTDGFSLYTVEFTYNELEYVMPGDQEVKLKDILDAVGLAGDVSEAESSAPELFSVEKNKGEWVVSSKKAFSTEETLTVIINGIQYEITVTDAGAVCKIGSTEYTTLKAAFDAASSGDTITLLGEITQTEPLIVEGDREITLDMAGHTITGQGIPAGDSIITIKDKVSLNVKNGKFASSDGDHRAILANDAAKELSLDGVDFSGFGGVYMGGAVFVRVAKNFTATNCTFANNSANIGGAVATAMVDTVTFTGNTLESNKADDQIDTASISDRDKPYYGLNFEAWKGCGGGLALMGKSSTVAAQMADNTFTNNSATRRGGAMTVCFEGEGSSIELTSGRFEGNSADWGGALDYTAHYQPTLVLNNVAIYDNTAVRGGGVWVCPQGTLDIGYNLGGSIFDNTASGSLVSQKGEGVLGAAGDDINVEGNDSHDIAAAVDGSDLGNPVTVVSRGLGGVQTTWYEDTTEHRYQAGDEEADPETYTRASQSLALHGEMTADGKALSKAQATLVFVNNTARTRGGAIATNSPIEIGNVEAETTHVVMRKDYPEFTDQSDMPEVEAVLYRVDAEGNKVAIQDGIKLNEDNEWTRTVTDLPTIYVDKDGNVQNYTYTVGEKTIEGFSLTEVTIESQSIMTATAAVPNTAGMKAYWPDADIEVCLVDSSGQQVGESRHLTADNNWGVSWEFENVSQGSGVLYTLKAIDSSGSIVDISEVLPMDFDFVEHISGTKEFGNDDGDWDDGRKYVKDGVTYGYPKYPFETTQAVIDNWNKLGFEPEIDLRVMQYTGAGSSYHLNETIVLNKDNNWSVPVKAYATIPQTVGYPFMYVPASTIRLRPDYSEKYADESTYALKNERVKVALEAEKEWADGSAKKEVEVQLYKGDEPQGTPVKLNENNSWKYRWTPVYLYDDNGKKIEYSIREMPLDGYAVTYSQSYEELDKEIADGVKGILHLKVKNTEDKKDPPQGTPKKTYGAVGDRQYQDAKDMFTKGTGDLVKYELLDANGDPASKVTVYDNSGKKIGDYTIDVNGRITFTPVADYGKGSTTPISAPPVTVRVTDSNGLTAKTTYTPHVVDATQTKTVSRTITWVYNDKDKTPVTNAVTQTTTFTRTGKVDPETGEVDYSGAKWTAKTLPSAANKKVAGWTPDRTVPAWSGTPDDTINDIEVIYNPDPPTGTPDTTVGYRGAKQKGKVKFDISTPTTPSGAANDIVKIRLIDPVTGKEVKTVTIKGEGKYVLSDDGTITFTPEKDFVGTAGGVRVIGYDANGLSAYTTYTPTVVYSYTVTYVDRYTGRTIKKTVTVNHGENEPDPPADPVRAGYRFTGWKRVVEYNEDGVLVSVVYEAQWKKLSDAGAGGKKSEKSAKTPAKKQLTSKAASTKTGDEFDLRLWLFVMAITLAGMIISLVRRRTQKRE